MLNLTPPTVGPTHGSGSEDRQHYHTLWCKYVAKGSVLRDSPKHKLVLIADVRSGLVAIGDVVLVAL